MKLDIDKYKAFFFDFDGVIVDSLEIKTEAFGSLFAKYGQEVVQKVIDYHLNNGGISRYEKFKYYYNEFLGKEITPKIIAELDKQYSSRVVEKVVAASTIEGVMDFLKELDSRGKFCFLLSATPQDERRKITQLRGIDGMFKEIVGSPQKKSQNLRYLLDKYSIQDREAVYFGDTKSDYEVAAENNVDFVGIVNTKSKELKELSVIPKIKDFRLLKIT